ncbi:MAG: DsrE family protein [Acidithiobacillus sp.]|nr:DsrE family protein [Acidithiobacillus sp.]
MAHFFVNITHAANDLDRATVGLVLAKNALVEGHELTVFLSLDGVHLARNDAYVHGLQEPTFPPVQELRDYLVQHGAKIWICAGCFAKRGLEKSHFISEAQMVSAAEAIKTLASGVVPVYY